jgi:DNA mismatch repair ATPase MutL
MNGTTNGRETLMRLSTFTGTSSLLLGFLLTFGFAAPSYAQDQQSDKPKQQESGKPQDAKPEHEGQPRQQAEPPKTPNEQPRPDKEKEARPPREQPQAEQPKTEKQSQQAEKQNEQQLKDQEKAQKQQEKTQKEQQKAQQQQYGQRGYSQQQSVQQSGRGGGGRIPDDRFRAHFGREHHFHVGHPQIVEGQPRFEYSGYSFIIVQAWPADWGYDDDVYIIDDGGVYYLCDVAHPGVQLELNVIL